MGVLPSQKQIECRAYRLWEQAGMPKGRDQEFYLEAERQLKKELLRDDPSVE
ncbi:Protein of unknown function [Bradyrhizobium arachidis]|uniref:DUF2934 domain-containing protein n=2 Tax=Nitrobacteraceae TaxID=41294 RepID=A0AAE7TGS8_9BRAD|nr:DUF2934 domain-containing protein [Bradyrhizobium sp. SEMIA]QOZ68168.1 DUF2934 domain-containing protein [Bradyrhizobium arachidis]SFV18448.1 Protein of unknown function [Bradyrhizobium arachidis]